MRPSPRGPAIERPLVTFLYKSKDDFGMRVACTTIGFYIVALAPEPVQDTSGRSWFDPAQRNVAYEHFESRPVLTSSGERENVVRVVQSQIQLVTISPDPIT